MIKNANIAWGKNVEKPVDMYMKDTRKLKRKRYLKVTGEWVWGWGWRGRVKSFHSI